MKYLSEGVFHAHQDPLHYTHYYQSGHLAISRLQDTIKAVTESQPVIIQSLYDLKIALERLHQQAEYYETLSGQDGLTGLLNRRGFEIQAEHFLRLARRHGDQGVIGICDLNNFKHINDSCGHHVGDFVLKDFGKKLRSFFRTTDLIARIGGDEFIFMALRVDQELFSQRLGKMRDIFQKIPITVDGTILHYGTAIGAIPYDGKADIDTLFKEIDRNMYHHKKISKCA